MKARPPLQVLFTLFFLYSACYCTVFFEETFGDGDKWQSRWVQSKSKDSYGGFTLGHGQFYGDKEASKGIKTSQDARFYALSSKFSKVWETTKGKDFILLFTVKHEQGIDCGGGYVKILPATVKLEEFNGDSDYLIMFGPDICGASKRVHVILNYKGENHLIKKEITAPSDRLTHLFQLVIKPDQTYQVSVDSKVVQNGTLEGDWDFLPPAKIKDPKVEKPKDWVEEPEMVDPTDKKPADWDKIPEYIVDPEVTKPEDWDDEMDGDWEAPKIKNPEFKEWKPKMIPNPNYKGPWVHPEIDNPEYKPDSEIYVFENLGALGLDLWQVKSGTIFDNFLLTDDAAYAAEFVKKNVDQYKSAEDAAWKKVEEAERIKAEEERRKMEEEAKRAAAASPDAGHKGHDHHDHGEEEEEDEVDRQEL